MTSPSRDHRRPRACRRSEGRDERGGTLASARPLCRLLRARSWMHGDGSEWRRSEMSLNDLMIHVLPAPLHNAHFRRSVGRRVPHARSREFSRSIGLSFLSGPSNLDLARGVQLSSQILKSSVALLVLLCMTSFSGSLFEAYIFFAYCYHSCFRSELESVAEHDICMHHANRNGMRAVQYRAKAKNKRRIRQTSDPRSGNIFS
jgi:hypothetical protein